MAGIQDSNVIDLVGEEASGRILVIMVETRGWGTDASQPSELREKINAYAGFIMDGTLARLHPVTVGKEIAIQLNCVDPPNGEISAIIDHAVPQLRRLGIRFQVHQTSAPPKVH